MRWKPYTLYDGAIITIVFLVAIMIAASKLPQYIENFTSKHVLTPEPQYPQRYYTKCGRSARKHNPATSDALTRLNIHYTDDPSKAHLYLPCGYNYMEPELAALDPANTQQVIFAVKGADQLCSKNQLWHRLYKRWGRNAARQITPETWVIANPHDIAALHGLPVDEVTQGVFILKKNIQRKRGLALVQGMQSVDQLISEDKQWRVVQRYIKHPLCIQGHKLNLRLYVCIVCPGNGSSPAWWLHQSGKCIYTASTYDSEHSTATPEALQDRQQHFTSFNLDPHKVYGGGSSTNGGGAGLPESLKQIAQHPDVGPLRWQQLWLDIVNTLSAIRQAYSTNRSNRNTNIDEDGHQQPGLCFIDSALKGHRCFQLFGMDVIVDTASSPSTDSDYVHNNYEPNSMTMDTVSNITSRYSADTKSQHWQPLVLEFNKGPEMSYKSPNDHIMKPQVMTDCLRLGLDDDQTGWQHIP